MDEAHYREKLNELEEQLAYVYAQRRVLLEAFADEHPPVLPAPRFQTDRQQRIARCPRCGGRLDDDKPKGGAEQLIEAGRPFVGDEAADRALDFLKLSDDDGAKK